MITAESISSAPAALVAGLITSLHCVGMCGPMAVLLAPATGDRTGLHLATASYHLTRVLAYTAIGAVLGALGQPALDAFNASPARFLPWAVVVFFLLYGLGAEKWLPHSRRLSAKVFAWGAGLRRLPRPVAGAGLGLLTPLLPCGPLSLVFGLALVLGSPVKGAEFLLAFGLGTMPLLYLAHTQYGVWRTKLPPRVMALLPRVLALAMAALCLWRLRGSLGGAGPVVDCPFCP